MGAQNIRENEPQQVRYNVPASNIKVHENWDTRKILNDIAVINLSTDITFTNRIQKVALPKWSDTNELWVGETCTTSGWGRPSDCESHNITRILT